MLPWPRTDVLSKAFFDEPSRLAPLLITEVMADSNIEKRGWCLAEQTPAQLPGSRIVVM
jgi:hypothetical protein